MSNAYTELVNAVNARAIGTFSTALIQTGESWYLQGPRDRQHTLRRVYSVTGTGTIAHGIDTTTFGGFTRIYGQFTDGTNWYTLPYVDVTGVTNQITITIDATNINITAGGGSPPTVSSGTIILEWLA